MPHEESTYFNSPEGQKSCDSLTKNNFVRATFQRFGAVNDRVWKNTKTFRNYWVLLYNQNILMNTVYIMKAD